LFDCVVLVPLQEYDTNPVCIEGAKSNEIGELQGNIYVGYCTDTCIEDMTVDTIATT
jgi:hypothetical protein